jgi:hypothetical protein
VLLCPMAEVGSPSDAEGGESLPLLHLTIVSQAGGSRGQVYYPYIAFRTSGVLQVMPLCQPTSMQVTVCRPV